MMPIGPAVPLLVVGDIETSLEFYVGALGFVREEQYAPEGAVLWCRLTRDAAAVMLQQACEEDPGCVAIRECAQENMCTGLDCLEVCGDVIDMYGGIASPSSALALALSGCIDAECPGLCD